MLKSRTLRRLPKIDSSLFDWSAWRGGSPLDLFQVPCRTEPLIRAGDVLRQHAVGWCPAESTPCRPKVDHIAVMFFKDDRYFWFHLRMREAVAVFG